MWILFSEYNCISVEFIKLLEVLQYLAFGLKWVSFKDTADNVYIGTQCTSQQLTIDSLVL